MTIFNITTTCLIVNIIHNKTTISTVKIAKQKCFDRKIIRTIFFTNTAIDTTVLNTNGARFQIQGARFTL